jgi:formylglycine-generating enzyme required for sulfatase activity
VDREPIDAAALLRRSAAPANKPDAEAAPSAPKAPWIPPQRKDLPRSRQRLLYGIGLLAALATLAGIRQLRERRAPDPAVSRSGMIRLPGGTFRMGSTAAEIEAECQELGPEECYRVWPDRERMVSTRDSLERELPARMVTLSPFYLDVHETTNAEFVRWLNKIASSLEIKPDGDSRIGRYVHDRTQGLLLADLHPDSSGLLYTDGHFEASHGYGNKPVVQVTWDAASLYCRWQGKRLPTEAEWEFAARGVSSRRFPWGNEPPRCDGVVFGRKDGGPQCKGWPLGVQDVGTSAQDRTPEGIWDLGGNANEWVQDQFASPYPDCGACINPKEERSVPAESDMRIQRGGVWSTLAMMTRGARRVPLERSSVTSGAGFRCASQ